MFTKRSGWEGAAMKDLGPKDWVNDVVCTISLQLSYCSEPVTLRVRKFKPIEGDVNVRKWTHNGVAYETPIEPYALEDIHKARSILTQHIETNLFDAIKQYTEKSSVHPLVQETYKAA